MSSKLSWMRAFWLTLHGDPRVQTLSDGVFRCFARVVAATWQTESPGVLSEKLARAWAFGGVEVSDQRWAETKAELEFCFLIESPDLWVHRRSADEYDRLQDQRERLRAHYLRRKTLKDGTLKPDSQRRIKAQQTSESNGTVETLFSELAADRREAGVGGCTRLEWEEGFENWFWPAYPRKVAKTEARREWMKIRPWTQELFSKIMAGLDRDAPLMRRKVEMGESEFVPHGRKWLHNRRWEDENAEAGASN